MQKETVTHDQDYRIAELLGEAQGRGWTCFAAAPALSYPVLLDAMSRTPTLLLIGSNEPPGPGRQRTVLAYQAIAGLSSAPKDTRQRLHQLLEKETPDGLPHAVRHLTFVRTTPDAPVTGFLVLARPRRTGASPPWEPVASWHTDPGDTSFITMWESTITRGGSLPQGLLSLWTDMLRNSRPLDLDQWGIPQTPTQTPGHNDANQTQETITQDHDHRLVELLGEAQGRGWACFAAIPRLTDPAVLTALSRTPALMIVERSQTRAVPGRRRDQVIHNYRSISDGVNQQEPLQTLLRSLLPPAAPPQGVRQLTQSSSTPAPRQPLVVLAEPPGPSAPGEWNPRASWTQETADRESNPNWSATLTRGGETPRGLFQEWLKLLQHSEPLDWQEWSPVPYPL